MVSRSVAALVWSLRSGCDRRGGSDATALSPVNVRTGPMMVACQWNCCAVSTPALDWGLSAAALGKPPQPQRSCTESDVPGHHRWGQLSRKKEDHYVQQVSQCAQKVVLQARMAISATWRPAVAGCHASKRRASPSEREGRTGRGQ
jgi:hypothetical protein